MNMGLAIFKRAQRLQGGKEDVSPEEQIKALIAKYDEAIAAQKREKALDEAFARRALEIPPILNKLPGQYQDYFPTEHEEVPIKRDRGRRYFDPGSLGQYPIMAQGGIGEVRGKESPFAEGGKWWWEKADEQARMDAQQAAQREMPGAWKEDSYKTIGVNINGVETEIPQWGGMTPDQAEEMARMRLEWGLDPFATDAELEARAERSAPEDRMMLSDVNECRFT